MLNVKLGKIRRAIADGEAKPGERLPSAKDLAAGLGVNTNTVLPLGRPTVVSPRPES
jgi:DNA-binding FadR family transcriptional regulator